MLLLLVLSLVAPPTADLVKRVKELYHKRVSDVRFLIPVLAGLEKQEVIAVLPKLIKQSPSVVKEVFNRLLGCFHSMCHQSSAIKCVSQYEFSTLKCKRILVLYGTPLSGRKNKQGAVTVAEKYMRSAFFSSSICQWHIVLCPFVVL